MTLFSRLAPLEEARMPGMARPRICLAPGLRPPLVVLLERLTLSASRATPERERVSQRLERLRCSHRGTKGTEK